MSAGEVIGLVAVIFFGVLVVLLAVPLWRLGRVLDETTVLVRGVSDGTVPLIGEVSTTVTQVNAELVRADAIAANVQSMTGNISALTSLFAATLGGPVVKVAAFTYGVRRAASGKRRQELERRVKTEAKAERASRRAERRGGRGA